MNTSAATHSFSAQTEKVLKLMIHALYTNRDIFLRELISNASDACDKRRYEALSSESLMPDTPFCIRLKPNEKAQTLTVSDNGIGMNREELVDQLGTIARSGTQAYLEQLAGNPGDTQLIGQFGVGFYSAFMVADRIVVESRKAGEDSGWRWESDGESGFTVAEITEPLPEAGTRITLQLKDEAKEYTDKHRLSHIVRVYSDYIRYPILLELDGEETRLNSGEALWSRPKSEISETEYAEFYRHIAHQQGEPWLTLHSHAEGAINYTSLLFVPGKPPFGLYHPDRRVRVKLYINRVFIAEEVIELIPAYLRFLQGVVDCPDLPLNISREALQQNRVMLRLQQAVLQRVLKDLAKKQETAPDDYREHFWNSYGPVFKEGLCESTAPRDQLLSLCLFESSNGGVTTLADYKSRMQPEQKAIYFLIGEQAESLRNHPQLEGFTARGIEVLLLSDAVDDFWVNVVSNYDGTPLRSVVKSAADLDAMPESADAKGSRLSGDAQQALCKALGEFYGEAVRSVQVSSRLTSSPVCLALAEGDMDIRLEQFLRGQKQLPDTPYAKMLEINPSHPIIRYLAAQDNNSAEWKDIASLLLDQARLLEGETLTDPSSFVRRMNELVGRALPQENRTAA